MSKFVNPFEAVDHHTEWSAAATFTEWANQIVKEEGLPFGPARVEKRGVDKKRPDCVLYDDPSCTKTALLIEFKQPYYDPFDAELKEAARQKAAKRKSPYFATSNFKTLILWNTASVNNGEPEENQIRGRFELSRIENLLPEKSHHGHGYGPILRHRYLPCSSVLPETASGPHA